MMMLRSHIKGRKSSVPIGANAGMIGHDHSASSWHDVARIAVYVSEDRLLARLPYCPHRGWVSHESRPVRLAQADLPEETARARGIPRQVRTFGGNCREFGIELTRPTDFHRLEESMMEFKKVRAYWFERYVGGRASLWRLSG
jgi:hypothetical protein